MKERATSLILNRKYVCISKITNIDEEFCYYFFSRLIEKQVKIINKIKDVAKGKGEIEDYLFGNANRRCIKNKGILNGGEITNYLNKITNPTLEIKVKKYIGYNEFIKTINNK